MFNGEFAELKYKKYPWIHGYVKDEKIYSPPGHPLSTEFIQVYKYTKPNKWNCICCLSLLPIPIPISLSTSFFLSMIVNNFKFNSNQYHHSTINICFTQQQFSPRELRTHTTYEHIKPFGYLKRRNINHTSFSYTEYTVKMSETKEFTYAEAAAHNTKKDLFMVIHDKVYDTSSFVDEHPGGEEVLLDVGGQDATEAFEDVGHSDEAREILDGLLVGTLKRLPGDPAPKAQTATAYQSSQSETGTGIGLYAIILIGGLAAFGAYKYLLTQEGANRSIEDIQGSED
ncbi:hypothetical protein EYC84_009840 [Monilinia fructicola]|uniref:Cytochrome b5 heme-binding domain-containing protein n=1 Tax=Monilinia fructicola TaxID=38448 RepID=A0A5M9J9W6_MONFR|nr:hypothetical protein EYC84_009840 [Monilinia fructicola]